MCSDVLLSSIYRTRWASIQCAVPVPSCEAHASDAVATFRAHCAETLVSKTITSRVNAWAGSLSLIFDFFGMKKIG